MKPQPIYKPGFPWHEAITIFVGLVIACNLGGCALRPCSPRAVEKMNHRFRGAVTLACNYPAVHASLHCTIPRYHDGRHHFHHAGQCLLTWRDRPVPKHLRGR